MRIVLVSLLLLALPIWALAADDMDNGGGDDAAMAASSSDTAMAAGDFDAGCLTVPNGCSIDCVGIELSCCKNPCECPEGKQATLRVEFMGEDGSVLASADVSNDWCNPCKSCRVGPLATMASLNNPIDPCAIKTARLSVVDGPQDGINVKTLVLWVRDPQGRLGTCEKWYKAYKCSPPCCQVLGAGSAWTFTSNGCCKPCGNPCGCNKCASKCNSCNKCGMSKCGCDKCAKPACGCNKCGAKQSCNTCNKCASKCNTCEAKPACGCNKCATTKCGCNKCDKCSAKPACGCSKCGPKQSCNTCNTCKSKCNTCAAPKCGCSKCGSKCNTCNKCGTGKCGCSTCGH